MRALVRLCVILCLVAAQAATGEAGPRLTTRIRRGLQRLHVRLPEKLKRPHPEVEELFGDALVPDPTTRVGFGARSERDALVRRLGHRMDDKDLAALRRGDGRPATAFIEGPDLAKVPAELRPQLHATMATLERMVAGIEAQGDPFLARLMAVHQSMAFRRGLSPARYEDEVPSPSGFRQSRLMLVPPERGSRRSILLRSRQPSEANLHEVVAAARKVGIAPEEIAILDLRSRHESERDTEWVGRSGRRDLARVTVIKMPILDHTVPSDAQLREALRLVLDPRFKLVHVHCKGGRGRTGIVMAAVRILIDGWEADRAIAEARSLDMSRPLQEFYLRELADRWQAGTFRI